MQLLAFGRPAAPMPAFDSKRALTGLVCDPHKPVV